MSAPDTNLETQKSRHRPALSGMSIGALFAGVLLVGYVAWLFIQTDDPEGAALQVEPGVGLTETD